MARGIVTPWRTHRDLLEVRKQLYRLGLPSDAPDVRYQAVQRVMAWKARGNLPHAVECTALLLDAVLHHRDTANSIFSVRAVYSAAFTRFVTGFCDIGRSKERMLEPSSMLEIAKQIDMPVEFVTLRHEATHQELPEIHRLVQATEDALDWLWAVYWSRLDETASTDPSGGGPAAMAQFRIDAKQRLREFRSSRREALRSRQPVAGDRDQDVWRSAKSCVELMGGDLSRINAFVSVLLEDKLLVPSKRDLGAPLDGAFLMWDRLLQEIFNEEERFMKVLIQGMLVAIDTSTVRPAESDSEAEALCLWLVHLADHRVWPALSNTEKDIIQTHIIKWCCAHPSHWAYHLGTLMMTLGGAEVQGVWGEILSASKIESEDLEMGSPGMPVEVQGPSAAAGLEDPSETWKHPDFGRPGGDAAAAFLNAGADRDRSAKWSRQVMQPTSALGVAA